MTIEQRAKNIASLLNYIPALADGNYAAMVEELKEACAEAREEGYEQGRDISLLEDRQRHYEKGFSEAIERAAKVVEKRMEQNAIATDLYTLADNKLARKVQAWMFDVCGRIRALKPI